MADLTTLANVKAYAPGLAPAQSGDDSTFDALLSRLITATSAQFEGEADRVIPAAAYTEVRNGNGKNRITPRHFPVLSVTSVTVDGTAIDERATVDGSGWVLQDDAIYLVGATFSEGVANVEIVYTAGFGVSGEAGTVPANPGPYQVQAARLFAGDVGVTIGGLPATKVSGAPAAGQYAVSDAGLYTFAAANAGAAVSLTYGTCPSDIEQAVIKMVLLQFHDRRRIGLASTSQAGEATSFNSDGTVLAYWRSVVESYRCPEV